MGEQIRVLVFLAEPRTLAPLRVERELDGIIRAFESCPDRDRVQLREIYNPRLRDFFDNLVAFRPHVLHFSGHGSEKIFFVTEEGQHAPLGSPSIAATFRGLGSEAPKVLVLAACSSLNVARDLTRYVEFAIGVSDTLADADAIEFTSGFYAGIAAGRSIDEAFSLGRGRIGRELAPRNDFWLECKPACDPGQTFLLPSGDQTSRNLVAELLDARLFTEATSQLRTTLALRPHDGQAGYYLALAKLRGRRPAALVNLDEARDIDQCLERALATARGHLAPAASGWQAAAYLLRALIVEDLYERNGLFSGSASCRQFLESSLDADASTSELIRLLRLVAMDPTSTASTRALGDRLRHLEKKGD